MLGYTKEDLDEMINSVSIAYAPINGPEYIEAGLIKAQDFLQGLWAEGYFD